MFKTMPYYFDPVTNKQAIGKLEAYKRVVILSQVHRAPIDRTYQDFAWH
jgi:hypothetical protein